MKIKDLIQAKYNFNISNITKNKQSTDGNVYALNCENEKYIFKIYDNIDHAKSMIELHEYLIKNDINVPKIIRTKCNENYIKYHEKFIVIYSFLDGTQITNIVKNNKLDNGIIVLIAKELRRLHDSTNNIKFNLDELDFANKLERKSVIHFDLTKDNIFINDRKIGFIDFDDAKYGDSVCDVAIVISLLFISKKRGIDLEGINAFINSYYEDSEDLKNAEKGLIKQYAIDWINYVLNNNKFDTSTTESFKFKKDNIEKYL